MKVFILRYGVFTVFCVLLLGMGCLSSFISVRTKQPVTLITEPTGLCRIYMSSHPTMSYHTGDTLTVCQTARGDWSFVIVGRHSEPVAEVLTARPLHPAGFYQRAQGISLFSGTVFTGRQSMGEYLCGVLLHLGD